MPQPARQETCDSLRRDTFGNIVTTCRDMERYAMEQDDNGVDYCFQWLALMITRMQFVAECAGK